MKKILILLCSLLILACQDQQCDITPTSAPLPEIFVSIDADRSDWVFFVPGAGNNLGQINRSPEGFGAFSWKDAAADERTDLTAPCPGADILEFHITADKISLYGLVRMADIVTVGGDGTPQVQVALDLNRVPSSGETYFAGFAETSVNTNACWEYLLCTRFASGSSMLGVYTPGFSITAAGNAAISNETDCIEFSVPWTALGLSGRPTTPLRLSVASFLSTSVNDTQDINGTCNAIDVLTNYNAPGTAPNTWDEVSDNILDYYFDLYFAENGGVYAPLLISRVLYNAVAEPAGEYCILYNNTPGRYALGGVKIGDEETAAGNEGMYLIPAGNMSPGGETVIAYAADQFFTDYNYLPDYAINIGGQAVFALSPFTAWASGTLALGNSGDELLLLDARNTIIDSIAYGGIILAGLSGTDISAAEGEYLFRPVPVKDTNNMTADFQVGS